MIDYMFALLGEGGERARSHDERHRTASWFVASRRTVVETPRSDSHTSYRRLLWSLLRLQSRH